MKGKKGLKVVNLPKEIAQLMGEANQLFMFKKFDQVLIIHHNFKVNLK